MSFFGELKRRNVTRVAGVYIVVGWLLVQVATALEDSIGLPAWFDGLIVALLLIGLPVALIFAWAFELTPEGVVRTEAVPENQSITSETGRKLDYALAIAIMALVIVIVWQQSTKSDAPVAVPTADVPSVAQPVSTPLDASVAVLPFTDMSPAGDQEYFSDGLTEEILNLLVRGNAIEVVSRTSSFQFKNTTLGIPEIAAELNVRHVVEGSVRKSGDTIRVTAQLIDAATDRHLWSDTYDRPLTVENLFAIQDDVANSIFAALSEELGLAVDARIKAKRTTEDLDAYALFLQARPLYLARRDLDVVDELLGRAVEIDPGFSEAWEYKAAVQLLMENYGYSDLPVSELYRRGMEYAERALEIEPNSATALAAIANMQTDQATSGYAQHDWSDIIDRYTRALDIDPRNGSALNWRGLAYGWIGDMEAALGDFRQCVEYEPYYEPCVENLQWYLADMGRYDEAMQVLTGALDAGVAKFLYAHLLMLADTGNEIAFKAATNDIQALRDWRHHDELYEAYRNLDADHSDLVTSILAFYEAHPERSADFMYTTLIALGHDVKTRNSIGTWGMAGRKYRRSEKFRRAMHDSGLLAYWQEHGFPPVCRPVGDDDFECD
jgi:TolB-like protein